MMLVIYYLEMYSMLVQYDTFIALGYALIYSSVFLIAQYVHSIIF